MNHCLPHGDSCLLRRRRVVRAARCFQGEGNAAMESGGATNVGNLSSSPLPLGLLLGMLRAATLGGVAAGRVTRCRYGAAAVVVTRCSHGTAALLPWWWCGALMAREVLLPWHGRRCYQRRRTLLPTATAASDATNGDRRCYRRCAELLPLVVCDAPDGTRRCYRRSPARLRRRFPDAAIQHFFLLL